MSIELITPLALSHLISIEQAVLETLAYSDIFDYPLRVEEIHRYLSIPASLDDLRSSLEFQSSMVECQDGYYFLRGRQDLVQIRLRRESISRPALQCAILFGRMLGSLPFIRMVALTGSLALLNSDETADLDYLLVAMHGRVWMARAFALLFGRLTRLAGYTLCPNLIISDRALAWRQPDVYTAHEICQMVPISGTDVYAQIRRLNDWTETFLPNATGMPPLADRVSDSRAFLRLVREAPLQGGLGNMLEAWEMTRKVRRFSQQAGFGTETQFDADMCQGNFNHHGTLTRQALHERLMELGIESSVALSIRQSDPAGLPVGENALPAPASRNDRAGECVTLRGASEAE